MGGVMSILNKIVEKEKELNEGMFDRRMKSMKQDIESKYGSMGQGGTLVDKVYMALVKVPEFNRLSMDSQGEISMMVVKMMK